MKYFSRVARFFADAGKMTQAILEAVVLVVVVIMLDTYVIANDSIINSSTTIGAAVVPILQAALLIGAILGAIAIIYVAATQSGISK